MEIGFRHSALRPTHRGRPLEGGGLHYFLHANLSASQPMGVRRGVQLVVLTDRLFAEREKDALILRVEGFSGESHEDDNVVRARLKARIGAPYARATTANLTLPRIGRAGRRDHSGPDRHPARGRQLCAPRRALCLLAADEVVNKLSQALTEPSPRGDRESGGAAGVRRLLALRRETGRHDALRRTRVRTRVAVARLARVAGDGSRGTGVSRIAERRLEHRFRARAAPRIPISSAR
jgi:hypothetical protein